MINASNLVALVQGQIDKRGLYKAVLLAYLCIITSSPLRGQLNMLDSKGFGGRLVLGAPPLSYGTGSITSNSISSAYMASEHTRTMTGTVMAINRARSRSRAGSLMATPPRMAIASRIEQY